MCCYLLVVQAWKDKRHSGIAIGGPLSGTRSAGQDWVRPCQLNPNGDPTRTSRGRDSGNCSSLFSVGGWCRRTRPGLMYYMDLADPIRRQMSKKKWLLVAVVVAAGVVSVGFLAGWEIAAGLVMASGTVLGVSLGAFIGNRKARKVDAYRDEWIAKRSGRKSTPSHEDPPSDS